MSFSGEVKQELLSAEDGARCCMIAELSAMIRLIGSVNDGILCFHSENKAVLEKCFTLLKKAFNIESVVKKSGRTLTVDDETQSVRVMRSSLGRDVLERDCCKRAFLRGAFLAAGSVSTPEKYYHLELVSENQSTAGLLRTVMRHFSLDAKIVRRKKDFVVYLKDGEQIVTMLGEMGAGVSFLNLECIRVMKEMRGSVNRQVNCETANMNKTIVSAVRQTEDIRLIKAHGGLGILKPQLREMAEVRLRYPDAPLAALGQYLDPPIGKSGVNHRLKKLGEIAATFRDT